jgi:predicted dehydrogenase
MMAEPLGVGLVGAGAFGEFCLAAFADMPELRIAAVADTDSKRAEVSARKYGTAAYSSLDALLADDSVQIVALNTPPFLHAEQGLAILNVGKHLFCEKPLALSADEGESLLHAAESNGVRLTVDYVMRRNPLWQAAARLRESGILGKLLHFDLANHAAGLNLPPSHWFWDASKSGGIWIEHGVHFFDAAAWVAGTAGSVIASQAFRRDDGAVDRVECIARYGDTAAHFYHGFTHDGQTEQTTAKLTFERAFLTLHEWVPTRLQIITPLDADALAPYLPDGVTAVTLDGQTLMTATLTEKSAVYRQCIQNGISDLAQAVLNPSHPLSVTGQHGLDSLVTAIAAQTA